MEIDSGVPLHIVVISGSMRPDNYTSKALGVVVQALSVLEDVSVEVIDPMEWDLALSIDPHSASARRLHATVAAASGVILSTPEYHGSYSSAIKLVIDNLGYPSALAGKPVALLGVASGGIGAVKALDHLRSVCGHVGAIVLPHPVSIAGIEKMFDDAGRCIDPESESRIQSMAADLVSYLRNHRL